MLTLWIRFLRFHNILAPWIRFYNILAQINILAPWIWLCNILAPQILNTTFNFSSLDPDPQHFSSLDPILQHIAPQIRIRNILAPQIRTCNIIAPQIHSSQCRQLSYPLFLYVSRIRFYSFSDTTFNVFAVSFKKLLQLIRLRSIIL